MGRVKVGSEPEQGENKDGAEKERENKAKKEEEE